MPIFRTKDKNGNRSVNFAFFKGISEISAGTSVNVTQNDNKQRLEIKVRLPGKEPFCIRYRQICDAKIISSKHITTKYDSVIGNALLGNLFFGERGAIIGSMKALQPKTEKVDRKFLLIAYHPSSPSGEMLERTNGISLEIVGATYALDKFIKELKEKCNIQPEVKQPLRNGGYL